MFLLFIYLTEVYKVSRLKSVGEEYQVVKRGREYHGCGDEYSVEERGSNIIFPIITKNKVGKRGKGGGNYGEENLNGLINLLQTMLDFRK